MIEGQQGDALDAAEEVDTSEAFASRQLSNSVHDWTRERRKHQCSHDSCDSSALYDVYLHLRYGWHLIALESMKSTLHVCDKHKKHAERFLTSDHNKKNISRELAKIGRLGIDWDNAMVEFVPFGELSIADPRMVCMGVA